jgi:hypothetical protein
LINTSSACCADIAFDGRPRCPVGSSVSSTTFRRTRSRAMAPFTDRFRADHRDDRAIVTRVQALAPPSWPGRLQWRRFLQLPAAARSASAMSSLARSQAPLRR